MRFLFRNIKDYFSNFYLCRCLGANISSCEPSPELEHGPAWDCMLSLAPLYIIHSTVSGAIKFLTCDETYLHSSHLTYLQSALDFVTQLVVFLI